MNNENEDRNSMRSFIVVLIIIVIILVLDRISVNRMLDNTVRDYYNALMDANSEIEELNSSIENAQSYTWSSYEEMGAALDELYTVATIPNPSCYPDDCEY